MAKVIDFHRDVVCNSSVCTLATGGEPQVSQFSPVTGARKPVLSVSKLEAFGGREVQAQIQVPAPDTTVEKARRQRRHSLILPREHGAWGLLLVPMITGTGVALHRASNMAPLILLATAALALFWLRTPLESLLGTSAMRVQNLEESRTVRSVIVLLAAIAAVALAALLWSGRNADLWPLGAAVAACFILQTLLKQAPKLKRLMWRQQPRPSRDGEAERPRHPYSLRMLSEIVGCIGLTASAPAAYYVITGKFDSNAWMLWVANLLFAGDQIHYVQLRIHSAKVEGFRARLLRGWPFAVGQAIMTAVITVACMDRLMPPIASIAFAPLLFRGWFYFIQEPAPLVVRRLGWNELKHATVFCILFISAFSLAAKF